MQNQTIATICHLAHMLEQQTEERENNEDETRRLSCMLDNKEAEVENLRRQVKQLKTDLQWERDKPTHTAPYNAVNSQTQARAGLFELCMSSPEKFIDCINYLRSEEARADYANKIRLIKRVREIGCYGLKEAKDVVEYFLDHPTAIPDGGSYSPPARAC